MAKSRDVDDTQQIGTFINYTNGDKTPFENWTYKTIESMDLGDHGHYGYPTFQKGKPYSWDIGGQFLLHGRSYQRDRIPTANLGIPTGTHYDGDILIREFGFPVAPTGVNALAWSATAWNRMKPTKPSFQILNFLYEMKDMPDMLRQRFTPDLKSASNVFLANKFGWQPLLSDCRKMVGLQRDLQKRLIWLLRHNGKPVRRRVQLLESSTDPIITTGQDYSGIYPVFQTQMYKNGTRWTQRDVTYDKVWASALFRYWLPAGPRDINWTRRMLYRIYGAQVTPSVVYNAIPWSWLVDWFTNAGDVISNLDAGVADRLAADYFYIMRTFERVVTKDVAVTLKCRDGSWADYSGTSVSRSYSKSRDHGTPFGFGWAQGDLNLTQLAILGALGISRI